MRNRAKANLTQSSQSSSSPATKPTTASKKVRRDRTKFSANVAASLAVPDEEMLALQTLPQRSASSFNLFNWMIRRSTSYLDSLYDVTLRRLQRQIRMDFLQKWMPVLFKPAPKLLTHTAKSDSTTLISSTLKTETKASNPKTMRALLEESQLKKKQTTDESIIEAEELKRVMLSKEHIIEHACRRVDLFLYLLIAVRGTELVLDKDKTIAQNGIGSTQAETQACHSSLFPNVSLQAAPPAEQGLFKRIFNGLWSYVFGQAATPDFSSLKNTHFFETLNSTVEAVKSVNDFDGHLEGRWEQSPYVQGCIMIANKVSKKKIGIIQGMNDFFKYVELFFNHFEMKYVKNPETPDSMKKVYEYQKEGTFKPANKDLTINMDYVYMMLRIPAGEIYKVKLASLLKQEALLDKYYKRIQEEIFQPIPAKEEGVKSIVI